MYGLVAMLCLSTGMKAQPQPLGLGDTLPAMVLKGYRQGMPVEYPTHKQPVIIDFFATWCAPCMALLPTLDSLQQLFGNRLQIIVAGYEPWSKVEKQLSKKSWFSKSQLVFVPADSLLRQYFPHNTVPHEAWIDQHGQVKAITSHEALNIANLRRLQRGEPLTLPVKADILQYQAAKSLLSYNPAWTAGAVQYGFALCGSMPGNLHKEGLYVDSSGFSRVYFINSSLSRVLAWALQAAKPLTIEGTENVPEQQRWIFSDAALTIELTLPGKWKLHEARHALLQQLELAWRCSIEWHPAIEGGQHASTDSIRLKPLTLPGQQL
jgi:thiol-disulfide isomerase/thioredoxin